MIYSFQAAILASLTATTFASPLLQRAADFGPSTVFEKANIPKKWTPAGAPSAQATMTMQIALKQNNIAGLQAKLADIANPKSPNYGKWLSKQDMETYTSPSTESVQAVTAWLATYGVSSKAITQPTPDWM
jgi:tripeptidyl-peptidase-1